MRTGTIRFAILAILFAVCVATVSAQPTLRCAPGSLDPTVDLSPFSDCEAFLGPYFDSDSNISLCSQQLEFTVTCADDDSLASFQDCVPSGELIGRYIDDFPTDKNSFTVGLPCVDIAPTISLKCAKTSGTNYDNLLSCDESTAAPVENDCLDVRYFYCTVSPYTLTIPRTNLPDTQDFLGSIKDMTECSHIYTSSSPPSGVSVKEAEFLQSVTQGTSVQVSIDQCVSSVPESTFFNLVESNWGISPPLSCGQQSTFTFLDSNSLTCTVRGVSGDLSSCYSKAITEGLTLTTTCTSKDPIKCTACDSEEVTATFQASISGYTLASQDLLSSVTTQCKCQLFYKNDKEQWVPEPEYHWSFVSNPSSSTNEDCGSIQSPLSQQCMFVSTMTIAPDLNECLTQSTPVTKLGHCDVGAACTAPTCQFIPDDTLLSPITLELSDCPVQPEPCVTLCIPLDINVPIGEPFTTEQITQIGSNSCDYPAGTVCNGYKPSLDRLKVCVDADNIRIPCGSEEFITEPDILPDSTCSVACFPVTFDDFASAVAADQYIQNCDPNSYRDTLPDACEAESLSSNTRKVVCMRIVNGIAVELSSQECSAAAFNFNQLDSRVWTSSDCVAYCHVKSDTSFTIPEVGEIYSQQPSDSIVDICTPDLFKPSSSICFETLMSSVRETFCTITINKEQVVIESALCRERGTQSNQSFPTDSSQCATLCYPTGNTIPNSILQEDLSDHGLVECAPDLFRPDKCFDHTNAQVRAIRSVGCFIVDSGSNLYTKIADKDCILADSDNDAFVNAIWTPSTQCSQVCGLTTQTFTAGEYAQAQTLELCSTHDLISRPDGCAAQTVHRQNICAIIDDEGFFIDATKPCPNDVPETTDVTWPPLEVCTAKWMCSMSDNPQFDDLVECSDAQFNSVCDSTCISEALSTVTSLFCVEPAPGLDGSIVALNPEDCGSQPVFDCQCSIKCRRSSSDEFVACTDDAAQWNLASSCGDADLRESQVLNILGDTVDCNSETCSPELLENPDLITARVPADLRSLCASSVSQKCASTPLDPLSYKSCDDGYGFPACSDINCPSTVPRDVKCFLGNDFFTESDIDPDLSADAKTAYYNNVIEFCVTEETSKVCPCSPMLSCLIPANPETAVPEKYAECDDQSFGPCQTRCEGDALVKTRSIYCRQADGTYQTLTTDAEHQESVCTDLELPDFTKTCDVVPCAAAYFCQDISSTTQFVNGPIPSNNICDENNFFSSVCYQKSNDSFEEDRCVNDATTADLYRRRDVQCLIYNKDGQTPTDTYPLTVDAAPAADNYDHFCKELFLSSNPTVPATELKDTVANCADRSGCPVNIDSVGFSKSKVKELEEVTILWEYNGPLDATAHLELHYAFATSSSPSASFLQWVSIKSDLDLLAETMTWQIPIIVERDGVTDMYIRATVTGGTVTTPLYTYAESALKVDLLDNCQTAAPIDCDGPNLDTANSCAMVDNEPVCGCIAPTEATTFIHPVENDVFGQCERTTACDAMAPACLNDGYRAYDSSLSEGLQCASKCTCPGGQVTENCDGACAPATTCHTQHGRAQANSCRCGSCFRDFAGRYCELCVSRFQITISHPNSDIIAAFSDASKILVKNSFANKLVAFVAQTTGYNKAYLAFDSEFSKYTSNDTPKLSCVLKFTGECPSSSAFNLLAAPQVSSAATAWDINLTASAFQASEAYKMAKTTESAVVVTPSSGTFLPAEVVDCSVDKNHPACQGPKDKKDDDSTVIIIVVVCVVGGLLLVLAILAVVIFCSRSSSSSASDSVSDAPKEKKLKPKSSNNSSTESPSDHHLELI